MKTAKLEGTALNWAVAKCEGYVPINHSRLATVIVERADMRGIVTPEHISSLRYSTNWLQGGPIIEREGMDLWCTLIGNPSHKDPAWRTSHWRSKYQRMGVVTAVFDAPTPLIATMRCYVASKLGDEVDIPEELLQ